MMRKTGRNHSTSYSAAHRFGNRILTSIAGSLSPLLLVVLTACTASVNIPDPVVQVFEVRELEGVTYVDLWVQNKADYPDRIFREADDPYICGRDNVNNLGDQPNHRTWFEYYDADYDTLIYAGTRNGNMNYLTVHFRYGHPLPSGIYLLLRDRATGEIYRSNTVSLSDVSRELFLDPSVEWTTVYTVPGSQPLQDLARKPTGELWAVGGSWSAPDLFLRADTSGDSWSIVSSECGSGVYDIDFLTDQFGVAVSGNSVYRTEDGGESWEEHAFQQDGLQAVDFPAPDLGYIAGAYEILYKTTNSGESWVDIFSPGPGDEFQGMYFADIDFIDQDTGWISGYWPHAQELPKQSVILHTEDGGDTWELQYDKVFGSVEIAFVDVESGWAVAEVGLILHTNDGGENWIDQYETESVPLTSIFFLDMESGWVGGENGLLLQTEDGGSTWTSEILPIYDAAITSILADESALYVTDSNGNILRRPRTP